MAFHGSTAALDIRLSKQKEKNMRAFTSVFGVLLLLVSWNGPAWADLLVASFDSFQVLRYDDTTGAFLGIFATGLPNDRPLGMTVGADGNLYVGTNNFGPPFQSFIRRFDGQTGEFIDTFASGGGLLDPGHLVFGPDGNLYVASFGGTAPNSKVIRYNGITGAYIDDFVPVGSGGLSGAEGLVFGPDGNLYVLNSSGTTLEVLRFDGLTGAFIDVFVNAFSGGSDGSSLVFGRDGNLYVTTAYIGNSVRRFDGSTGQFIDEFVPQGGGGLAYATGLLFFTPSLQLISIDIKPGSFPNSINPKSKGKIPVAILTTDSFDATTVDPTTVLFGRTGTEAAPVHSALEDVDGDWDTDMILHFKTQETGIQCGDTSASLTGETFVGQAIEGSDSIRTVGCK